jgi:hypothetical protein
MQTGPLAASLGGDYVAGMQNQTVASPSLRVHRVFNRLGLVLGGLCLMPCVLLLALSVVGIFSGNGTGAAGAAFTASLWFAGALFAYGISRSIGWVIAGAMKF